MSSVVRGSGKSGGYDTDDAGLISVKVVRNDAPPAQYVKAAIEEALKVRRQQSEQAHQSVWDSVKEKIRRSFVP